MWNSASAAAASSTSFAAAIDDGNSDEEVSSEEEMSGDFVISSNDEDDASDEEDDVNDDDDFETVFFRDAQDIQNWMSRVIGTAAMEDRRFRELFGAPMEIVLHVWYMMEEDGLLPDKSKPKHLLWTLYFLKVYPREAPGCSTIGGGGGAVDPKTLQKWVWLFIERIAELAVDVVSYFFVVSRHDCCLLTPPLPAAAVQQIVFESRLVKDVGNNCLMSIDGTNFQITQKGPATRGNGFASHKYAGKSVLRYELGIDILAGNSVWVSGPYPAGKWNDINFFLNELAHCLEPGERVEADNGYVGHKDKNKCPNNDSNPEENLTMQARVRSRHETFNARLKFWGILRQVYRHDITQHGNVLNVCAVLTQLAVANEEPLF
jgi:hypothetical protein